MYYINQKPLLGYGKEDIETVTDRLGNKAFSHAHNTILDVVFESGFYGLVAHFIVLIIPIKELYENRKNKLSQIISVTLFCFLLMMIFETRQENIGLFIVLTIAANIKHIIDYKEENGKNESD